MNTEVCSKCHEVFLKCSCENFHPPVAIAPLDLDAVLALAIEKSDFMLVNKSEAQALMSYFIERAGFISHEFDSKVHDFIHRLENFLK